MKWLIKESADLPTFLASDGCNLSEVIHPDNDRTASGFSIARASIAPGQSTKPHYLDFVEVYYLLSGQGLMHLDDAVFEIGAETCVYIEPGTRQWLENPSQDQKISFLCICHPAYDPSGDHTLAQK